MKRAILQVADTGPLESLVAMLRAAGWECYLPSDRLKHELRRIGCDTVLDISGLVSGMGYEEPMPIPCLDVEDMEKIDLYVDIKAHRCYDKIVTRWPNLKGKVLWYRINGGRQEHVIRRNDDGSIREDCGDEVNPPCPVLTPNQWYAMSESPCPSCQGRVLIENKQRFVDGKPLAQCECEGHGKIASPWAGRAYTCWPPFVRFTEYERDRVHVGTYKSARYSHPLCLIHNLRGWGYGALIEAVRSLGVRCHGAGSPDGLLPHGRVRPLLSSALCMVHLKSSDAPGYAIYESLASACPLVCTRRLIWRCRMQELLIPGETCLVFDRETHEGLTREDVEQCTEELRGHLLRLADPKENARIGDAGRARLKEVMWREDRDLGSLVEFMGRNFG